MAIIESLNVFKLSDGFQHVARGSVSSNRSRLALAGWELLSL